VCERELRGCAPADQCQLGLRSFECGAVSEPAEDGNAGSRERRLLEEAAS